MSQTNLTKRLFNFSRIALRNRRGRLQVQKVAIDCEMSEYRDAFNISTSDWQKVLKVDSKSKAFKLNHTKRVTRKQLHKGIFTLSDFCSKLGWSFFYFFHGSTVFKIVHNCNVEVKLIKKTIIQHRIMYGSAEDFGQIDAKFNATYQLYLCELSFVVDSESSEPFYQRTFNTIHNCASSSSTTSTTTTTTTISDDENDDNDEHKQLTSDKEESTNDHQDNKCKICQKLNDSSCPMRLCKEHCNMLFSKIDLVIDGCDRHDSKSTGATSTLSISRKETNSLLAVANEFEKKLEAMDYDVVEKRITAHQYYYKVNYCETSVSFWQPAAKIPLEKRLMLMKEQSVEQLKL